MQVGSRAPSSTTGGFLAILSVSFGDAAFAQKLIAEQVLPKPNAARSAYVKKALATDPNETRPGARTFICDFV